MNRILLAVGFIVFLGFQSFAQTDFVLLPSDTVAVSQNVNTGDIVENFMRVKNISNSPKTMKWICSYKVMPHAWDTNVCDIVNCYSFGYVLRTFYLNAGDSGSMRLDIDPFCTPGTGEVRLAMWVDGDSAGKVKYPTWDLNVTVSPGCVAGINDNFSSGKLKVYPNPVQHSFIVSDMENAENLLFEVYDMKGTLVKSQIKSTTNTSVEIAVENLATGTYVLKAIDKEGKTAGVARLNKID